MSTKWKIIAVLQVVWVASMTAIFYASGIFSGLGVYWIGIAVAAGATSALYWSDWP